MTNESLMRLLVNIIKKDRDKFINLAVETLSETELYDLSYVFWVALNEVIVTNNRIGISQSDHH